MNLLFESPELPPLAWSSSFPLSGEADVGRWVQELLDAAGPRVRKLSAHTLETARGWPLELLTYETAGRLLVVAVYEFFDLTGAIALGGLERDWLVRHELEITAALRAAEPDWTSDEPLTLRELWREPLA